MRDNKLTSLSDNWFLATPLLKVFNAERNQINRIGKSVYGLKNLLRLVLRYNELTDVDLMAFSQLPMLERLVLDENYLTSENITKVDFKEPSRSVLSHLSLAGNELTNKDDWKKFAVFPQLEEIDVRYNKYSKIDVGNQTLRQQFPKLTTVHVSAGKWSCGWLMNFVESSKENNIKLL